MKLYEITFSPTGGTKKAAALLSQNLCGEPAEIDLTDQNMNFETICLEPEAAAVIAVPSYGGRMPAAAAGRLSQIRGNGAKAILLCVYGNRAYEDTLAEMEDVARKAGFTILAAVAAIAEHSIAHQYAAGRPDSRDAEQLAEFAGQIRGKLDSGSIGEPSIPGNRPYKKLGVIQMIPKATDACVSCGLCAKKCPTGAISPGDVRSVDESVCISCMRCTVVCPNAARKVPEEMLAMIGAKLQKVCADRKECELYL